MKNESTCTHIREMNLSPAPSDILPETIRDAYELSDKATIQTLGGGHVNTTLLITEGREQSIIQRLSPAIRTDALRDAAAVSIYLASKGWEAPLLLPTRDGNLFAPDITGASWRRQKYIPSDNKPTVCIEDMVLASGELLGRWHKSIASLEYSPRFSPRNLHNVPYHATKLSTYMPLLPDKICKELATEILDIYGSIQNDTYKLKQVIHGDPKLDNMLFRDGRPFTLIDFDTLMQASPWIDVGDLLRSIVAKKLIDGQKVTESLLVNFTKSYHEAAELPTDPEQSFYSAIRSAGSIALELGMRYMCDIYDSSYFNWDQNRYDSRRDNHLARATTQLQVARTALNFIDKYKGD